MTGLHIALELTLPVDVVTDTFGILAKKGAGKSNAAVVMAEEMYDAGVPWVAIDPKGDWWGLRSSADGQGAGLPIVVFGGRHGDVPLEPTAGALLADLVLEQGLTCVLDVSEFSHADVRRFLLAFAERLYRQAEAEPLHLFLEEAHEYLPQMVRGEDAKLVGAWQRIVKQGRFKGIGVTLVTQRSAALNKDVLTQVDTLIALRTTSPQDRAAVKAWVDVHAESNDMLATLPTLESGEAWYWSPEHLGLQRIRFRRRRTFDSGATPKVGQKRRTPATLADVDLASIKEQMAETIEKAKADDPKHLRARVRDLEQQLAKALSEKPEPVVETIEVPVFSDADVDRFTEQTQRLLDEVSQLSEALGRAAAQTVHSRTPQTSLPSRRRADAGTPPVVTRQPGRAAAASTRPGPSTRAPQPPAGQGTHSGDSVPPARRKLLEALVSLEAIGVTEAPRNQVALFAGVSPKSSGYSNNLGAMNTAGLITYPAKGRVQITDEGRAHVDVVMEPATDEDLHARIEDLLSPARWRIIQPLIDAYPDPIRRDDLAEAAEVSASSSGYSNNLGALRSLGLLDYPGPGLVVAADVLFVEA